MNVLWFACSSACYEKAKQGSWIESLEMIFRKNLKDVQLGIAFEHTDNVFKVKRNGVTYFPINLQVSKLEKIMLQLSRARKDQILIERYMKIIEDFKPDIIQCFGSEWPYGLIVKYVNIPVVIHMMGCAKICNNSASQVVHKYDYLMNNMLNPWKMAKYYLFRIQDRYEDAREWEILSANKYFMGRTSWDKDIVNYFSPGSTYFHCEEAIRSVIYDSKHEWKFSDNHKVRIITIANPSVLKGNSNILMAASILKNEFYLDFEWRLTCEENDLLQFEKITGIRHEDVNLKMIGRISADEIARELSESQLYIHSSIIDNSPNSLCEAQLIGTPVVSSNVGGISALVKDGESGVLYPYNEPYTLAFRILELCHDRERLERLSTEERRVSHIRHNPSAIGERVYEIYQEILKNGKKNNE